MIYYTTSPEKTPLKGPKLSDSYFNIARVKTLSASRLYLCTIKKAHYTGDSLYRECADFRPCCVVQDGH